MRVLLFETTAYYPSSPLFLEALDRQSAESSGELEYLFVDEAPFRRRVGVLTKVANRALRRLPVDLKGLNAEVLNQARLFRPNVVLIAKGAFLTPETLTRLKLDTNAVLVNYATDDPFNPPVSTEYLRNSIPLYDVYACTKLAIIDDVTRAGCARVEYVPFGYKPEVHFVEHPATESERRRFDSDVVFIGGGDQDRAPIFSALLNALPHLNLALYGGHWNRWRDLRPYWRGFATGRDFRLAVSGAKIALNLVRRANRDDHVMRTFELPACGAFVLTERTLAHETLLPRGPYLDYFKTNDELISKVNRRLSTHRSLGSPRPELCKELLRHTYGERLRTILDLARDLA
jgi:spore maturation protein CgeB